MALVMVLAAWPAVPAAADPAADLLAKVTAGRPDLEALEAVYDAYLPGTKTTETSVGVQDVVQFRVSYRKPNRVRLNLSFGGREEVFLAVGSRTLTMVDDQASPSVWPQPFLLYRLILDRDPDALKALVEELDFDPARVSENGLGIRVLGADRGDQASPQAWFDGSGRLVRLIMPGARSMPAYDVTLEDYAVHDQGLNWPHTLRVSLDHGPAARLVFQSLTVNPDPAVRTPDPDFRMLPDEPPPAAAERDSIPEMAIIREQLEWFRKKYE